MIDNWSESLHASLCVFNDHLSENTILRIILTYAPTRASEANEVKECYQDLELALTQTPTYIILMGDFNAKVRKGWEVS